MRKNLLARKIREEFPKLQWQKAMHNVEGWDHYVLILDNKYVFRFPRRESYSVQLKNEIKILQYLRSKLNLPIPYYQFISKDSSFAGYEMIQGDQMIEKQFKKLSKKVKTVIAKQTALFLSRFHKTSKSFAKGHGIKLSNNKKRYQQLIQGTQKAVYPHVSKRDREMIENYLKEFKNYLKFPTKVVAHADFYQSHIILNRSHTKLAGIIDFSDMAIGDPAWDFAELWLYGKEFVLEVYKHYTGPKDGNFLKRSEMYCKRVPLWVMGTPKKFSLGYKMFKKIFQNPPF